jgi:hypothetical protein
MNYEKIDVCERNCMLFWKGHKDNVGTGKLNELKSHDYHIFIERLMPVMFCGYFKPDLWKMFAELSYFYRQICAKQVSKAMTQRFEKEIVVLVCKMETVFPPKWFNAM